MTGLVAVATTEIQAEPEQVWDALTDPDQIKEYMFGSEVTTDWQPGSPIYWRGEYEGRAYEDKGTVIEVEPRRRLVLTHYSPMSGDEDVPENYHTLVYELTEMRSGTRVSLRQDNNSSVDEVEHNKKNWLHVLDGLKKLVERRRAD